MYNNRLGRKAYDVIDAYAESKLGKFSKQAIQKCYPKPPHVPVETNLKKTVDDEFLVRINTKHNITYYRNI